MSVVLLTNVTQYAGPGALTALLADGHHVVCHDASFAGEDQRIAFERGSPMAVALAGQRPEDIHAEISQRFGLPKAIVLNDVYPITRNDIEHIPLDDLLATFEAVVLTPIRLTQLFLPAMKKRRSESALCS